MVKNNFDKAKKYQIGFVRSERNSKKFKDAAQHPIPQPVFARNPQSNIIPGSELLKKAENFTEYLSKNPDNLPTDVIFSLYEIQPDRSLKFIDKGSPMALAGLKDELPKEEPQKNDNSEVIALLKEYHKSQIETMKINQDLVLSQKDSIITEMKETINKLTEQINNRPATSPNEEYFKNQWGEALKEITRLNDEVKGLTQDYEKDIRDKNKEINDIQNQLTLKIAEFERFKNQTEQAEKFNKKLESQTNEWQGKFDALSDKMAESEKANGLGSIAEKAFNFLETPIGQALGSIVLQKFAGQNPGIANMVQGGPNPNYGMPGNSNNEPENPPATQGTPTGKTRDYIDELDNLPDENNLSDEDEDKM